MTIRTKRIEKFGVEQFEVIVIIEGRVGIALAYSEQGAISQAKNQILRKIQRGE